MFLRPNMYTSYEQESQILPTYTKKVLAAIGIIVLFLLPFDVPIISGPTDIPILRSIPLIGDGIPFLRFLGDNNWLRAMDEVFIFAIAALGLNILTGVAGQVSLGHAFFMGVGAYAGAVVGGVSTSSVWGWNLPIWMWLPAAGVVSALVGIIVSPVAVKLRGLYLAIVTLGLVFLGIHMSNTVWGKKLAGDPGLGRDFPNLDIRVWKEESPLLSIDDDGTWFGFLDISDSQKRYLFLLCVFLVFVLLAKNIIRTRTGRALQAIRDRDIAAEVMGVPEFKYKLIAFATSSFFAGVAGALYASSAGKLPATQFSLALSIEFIAILLIGGVGTVSGTIMGTFFVVLLPRSGGAVHRVARRQDRWHGYRGQDRGGGHLDRSQQRGADLGGDTDTGISTEHVRLEPGALRRADHRVPDLRTARSLRHLDQDPQLLEALAVQLLVRDGWSS